MANSTPLQSGASQKIISGGGYYYSTCPLCLETDDALDGSYYLLSLHPKYNKEHYPGPWNFNRSTSSIRIGDFEFTRCEVYREHKYASRAFLLHRRCVSLVGKSYQPFYCLLGVVEPTFINPLPGPANGIRGSFSPADTSFRPRPWSNQLLQALPSDVQAMIFERGVGRMFFVMKTAEYLSRLRKPPSLNAREQRFTHSWHLYLGNGIRIRSITLGGRTYVEDISAADEIMAQMKVSYFHLSRIDLPYPSRIVLAGLVGISAWSVFWACWLFALLGAIFLLLVPAISTLYYIRKLRADDAKKGGKVYRCDITNYLAVKSDGMGVIDLAFSETEAGPQWVLSNRAYPFDAEISIFRNANLSPIRKFRDSLKCRAILPMHRTGVAPIFPARPSPPRSHPWIEIGFETIYKLTRFDDLSSYCTPATYIPLETLRNIAFKIEPLKVGVMSVNTNVSKPENEGDCYACFSRPPTCVRLLMCSVRVSGHSGVFIQFHVDGKWKPSLPPTWQSVREPVVSIDAYGIWWGTMYPDFPVHMGLIVPLTRDPEGNAASGLVMRNIAGVHRKHGIWVKEFASL